MAVVQGHWGYVFRGCCQIPQIIPPYFGLFNYTALGVFRHLARGLLA
nr:MAG TPA: hypothetical protein [Crassvirales sp.]